MLILALILGVRVFGNSASGVPIWFVGPLCVFCDAWATRIDLGFASKSKVRSRGGRSSAGFRGGFFGGSMENACEELYSGYKAA